MRGGVLEFEDPGGVFELIAGREFGVVALAGLPHFPEDLEPAAQAARFHSIGCVNCGACPWS